MTGITTSDSIKNLMAALLNVQKKQVVKSSKYSLGKKLEGLLL